MAATIGLRGDSFFMNLWQPIRSMVGVELVGEVCMLLGCDVYYSLSVLFFDDGRDPLFHY